MPFSPDYVRIVLNENFEDAKALLLEPLMAIHEAHLVMLADTHIVSEADARTLRDALTRAEHLDAVRREMRRLLRGSLLRRAADRRRLRRGCGRTLRTRHAAGTTST